jgi:DNA-binding NtrC family response regulator
MEHGLVGDSAALAEVRELVRRVGRSDLSVLVRGPSGSGKELVARAIHAASDRRDRAVVALNCAAVPETLLTAELFGHRKGAFTSAGGDRAGLVESADGSTLFLDEVGDMPLAVQAALLRMLEQREVTRLGETRPRQVDFRIVAATHRDLRSEVVAGRFREDLRFRLEEVVIDVPRLVARRDDIPVLARFFLREAERQLGLSAHTLTAGAQERLAAHDWPGNVRELRTCMRRAAVLADGQTIGPADLRLDGTAPAAASPAQGIRPLVEAREEFVRAYVRQVLDLCHGNRERAARDLGIGVRTLYRYLK